MILKVGLTGGIASGKSTIARLLNGLGCVTLDADEVVTRLYRPGGAGHQALVTQYGNDILDGEGKIDRAKLANIAFSDTNAIQKLNSLIHPLVIAEEKRIIDDELARFPDRDRIFIIEATLLLESGGKKRYDRIVVVDLDPQSQIQRAVSRGLTAAEAERRMKHQLSREERIRHADYVIDNSGDRRNAEVDTHQVYERLRADLAARKNGTFAPKK